MTKDDDKAIERALICARNFIADVRECDRQKYVLLIVEQGISALADQPQDSATSSPVIPLDHTSIVQSIPQELESAPTEQSEPLKILGLAVDSNFNLTNGMTPTAFDAKELKWPMMRKEKPTEQSDIRIRTSGEREAFEACIRSIWPGIPPNSKLERKENGKYIGIVQTRWEAWQARGQSVPEGFKLAPIKPTLDMMLAGQYDNRGTIKRFSWEAEEVYRAMLAAAPSPKE